MFEVGQKVRILPGGTEVRDVVNGAAWVLGAFLGAAEDQ